MNHTLCQDFIFIGQSVRIVNRIYHQTCRHKDKNDLHIRIFAFHNLHIIGLQKINKFHQCLHSLRPFMVRKSTQDLVKCHTYIMLNMFFSIRLLFTIQKVKKSADVLFIYGMWNL